MLLSEWLKSRKNKTVIFGAIFLVLLTAMIVIFTFFDRDLSKAVYSPDSVFGMMFKIFGYLPAIVVDALLFVLCYRLVKNKGLRVLFHFLTASALAGGIITVFISFENDTDIYKIITFAVSGVLGIALSFLLIILSKKLSEDTLKKAFYVFLISAIMATLSVMIVYIFKTFWGRFRYYEVLEGKEYTPWYIPRGRTGGESFVSAHAMSSCSAIVLPLLAWKFEMKKHTKIILNVVAVLFIFCVSFSRIVVGWHYATDTMFAILFSFFCLIAGIAVTDGIYRKKQKNSTNSEQSLT